MREGGSRLLEPVILTFNEGATEAELAPGRDGGREPTLRTLAACGLVLIELDCSDEEVRALIRAGELSTVACGIRPGLVPRHQLDDYLRRLRHRLKESARSSTAL